MEVRAQALGLLALARAGACGGEATTREAGWVGISALWRLCVRGREEGRG